MSTQPVDQNLKSLQRAIDQCRNLIAAAKRAHDDEARQFYQEQLAHLETKLKNYQRGDYASLRRA